MSEQLQLRRGTAAQIIANTPAQGEVWVDTDDFRLVVGDGSTAGGYPVPKMSEMGSLMVVAKAVNANLVADTPLVIDLPDTVTRYRITRVTALAPSISLTTAQAALYNASGGTGVAICAPQALAGLTTNAAATAGNAIDLALALAAATFFIATTLYFRITTPQGSAATLDVILHIQPYD